MAAFSERGKKRGGGGGDGSSEYRGQEGSERRGEERVVVGWAGKRS